jgi:prophage regulatory protein
MNPALPRMITRKELRQLVPYCPQHILRLEKVGKFPPRIKIGKRRVGWWLHEVLAWIAARNKELRDENESQLSLQLDAEARTEMLSAP